MAFIGIDLGTTNSAAAVHRNGSTQMLRDPRGNEIVPSVVGIDNKTRELTVGERAKSFKQTDPNLAVEEVKRKMAASERLPLGHDAYLPQEVSALILGHLKRGAEETLGEAVDRAVITVPANFPDTARQATITAGELAGLKVERIINEPTAAALAYGHAEGVEEEIVMVYDLGGGTFDVSIVEYVGDALDVLASAGDPHLGGKDFDRALLAHVADGVRAEHGVAVEPSEGLYYTLLYACEQAKKELSFNPSARVLVPFLTHKEGRPISLDVEVSRADLERLIGPMVDRTEQAIKRALKDAGLDRSKVDRVLLVGGSTRIPYVRALVERVMGKRPAMDIDPDRAVAMGAAVQAAIIAGESDRMIMDVVPFSFGTATLIEVGGVPVPGWYSEVIRPQAKQLKPYTEPFSTLFDDQEVWDFKVYQRLNGSTSDWAEVNDEPNDEGRFWRLDRREIKLPAAPAGQEIRVTYTYNLNGTLDVELGFEGDPGRTDHFPVSARQTEAERADSEARLSALWQQSDHYGEVRATLHAAERKMEADLELSTRAELEALVAALKRALGANDAVDVRRLEGLLTDLLFDLED